MWFWFLRQSYSVNQLDLQTVIPCLKHLSVTLQGLAVPG